MSDGFYDLPTQRNIVPTAPATEIYLCAGVPWDNSYEHVRLFENETAIEAYLITKCPSDSDPWHIIGAAPISLGKPLRVKLPEVDSQIMDVNYLMFCNHNTSARWFYAFITGMEWLSDNSCVVTFELDIFQCCAYRATYNQCFTVREHVSSDNDNVGDQLVPENIEVGEIVCNHSDLHGFGPLSIGMLVTETLDGKQVQGQIIGNVYQGAAVTILQDDEDVTKESLANGLLSNYNDKGKIDAIVDVFMVPEMCRQQATSTVTVNASHAFGGYVPKNNKLYSYPYCYCLVDNNIGSTGIYKFEFDVNKSNSITFNLRGELCPLPAVSLRTENYEVAGVSYLHAMSYTGFPQCSWNSDVYRAWAAQNKNTLALETASNAIAPIKGGITGAVAGGLTAGAAGAIAGGAAGAFAGAVSGFENQAKLMANAMDKDIEPSQIHGKVSSINLNAAINKMEFNFYVMSATQQLAKTIDNFFEAYGYAVNSLKIPNLNSRPSWNFVKTSGCTFAGNVPPDMLRGFRAIFDRGVTIWHVNDIGNYSLSNH